MDLLKNRLIERVFWHDCLAFGHMGGLMVSIDFDRFWIHLSLSEPIMGQCTSTGYLNFNSHSVRNTRGGLWGDFVVQRRLLSEFRASCSASSRDILGSISIIFHQ